MTEMLRQKARADMDRIVREQDELEELVEEIKRRTAELAVLVEQIRLARSTTPVCPQWNPVGAVGD